MNCRISAWIIGKKMKTIYIANGNVLEGGFIQTINIAKKLKKKVRSSFPHYNRWI